MSQSRRGADPGHDPGGGTRLRGRRPDVDRGHDLALTRSTTRLGTWSRSAAVALSGKSKTASITCIGYVGAPEQLRIGVPSTENVTLSGGPLDGVRVEVGQVDREADRLEVLRHGRVADGLQSPCRPRWTRRGSTASPKTSITQISPHRSGWSSSPTIHSDTIDRGLISCARAQFDVPAVRRPAPERLLLLADAQTLPVRLLADRAADRPGVVAGLDPGHATAVCGRRAPQSLVRRDAERQAGVPTLYVAAVAARELHAGGSAAATRTGPAPCRRNGPRTPVPTWVHHARRVVARYASRQRRLGSIQLRKGKKQ